MSDLRSRIAPGSYTPVVTPFTDGEVDYDIFDRSVERFGIQAIRSGRNPFDFKNALLIGQRRGDGLSSIVQRDDLCGVDGAVVADHVSAQCRGTGVRIARIETADPDDVIAVESRSDTPSDKRIHH